jgi:uncharacterized protein DUF4345
MARTTAMIASTNSAATKTHRTTIPSIGMSIMPCAYPGRCFTSVTEVTASGFAGSKPARPSFKTAVEVRTDQEVSAVGKAGEPSKPEPHVDVVTVGLIVFGLYQVGIALYIVVAPGSFFETLGPFGVRSDHYLHDVAAFQAATGLLMLLAVRRPRWRVPTLAVALISFGLHAVSHLVDINEARPQLVGVLEFIGLAVATAIIGWLLVRAARETRSDKLGS